MTFVNFKTCCKDWKQLFRLVVLLICVCVSVYQLAECFRKIQYPPTSTHYGFYHSHTLRYPAVTICRNPPYKTDLFRKYGILNEEIGYATTWETFDFNQYTLQQFFEETTYTFEEIVIAALDKLPENLNVRTSFLLQHGRCFTVTPINESKDWGMENGYVFYFSHTDTKKTAPLVREGRSLSGFDVFIQAEGEVYTEKSPQADIYKEYIYVEAGDDILVNLKINKYHQLPSRNNHCNPNYNYSKSACEEDSLNTFISEGIGCSTPWVPNENLPPCNTSDQTIRMVEYSTPSEFLDQYHQRLECPVKCNVTTYTAFVQSNRQVPLPSCKLKIYFASNLYTQMEEVVGYDWNNLLSDLGGSLGFFLGLSVLGMIALVEHLIATAMKIREIRRATMKLNNAAVVESSKEGTRNDLSVTEDPVIQKNRINAYKMGLEFYSKRSEFNEGAVEKF